MTSVPCESYFSTSLTRLLRSIFVTKFQEKLCHAEEEEEEEEASKEAPVSLLANDQCDQNKIAKCL